MMQQLVIDILFLIGFGLMCFLQAIMINGIHESLKGSAIKDDINNKINFQGNILYMVSPKFFEKYKYRYWSKPLWTCIKCMSSIYGAITYWPLIIYFFEFKCVEVPVFFADIFSLVYMNYYLYKKV